MADQQVPFPIEFKQLANRAMTVVQQDNQVKIKAYTSQQNQNADCASKGVPLPYPGLMPPMLVALDTDKFISIFAADSELAKDPEAKVDHIYDNLASAYSVLTYQPPTAAVVVKPTQPSNPLGAPMDEDGNQFGSAPGDESANGTLYTTSDGRVYKKTSRVGWGGIRLKYWTLQE